MKRILQHSLAALAVAGLSALLLSAAREAQGQADKTVFSAKDLPRVEKHTHKKYVDKLPDTRITFEMVPIPGGTFLMGSPDTEKDRNADEGPQHPVQVKPFWMGACELTWDLFDPYWRNRPGNKTDKDPENPKDADAITRPTPAYADETFE